MDSNHLIGLHHSAIHYPKYIVKMDGLKELKVDRLGKMKMDVVLKILVERGLAERFPEL